MQTGRRPLVVLTKEYCQVGVAAQGLAQLLRADIRPTQIQYGQGRIIATEARGQAFRCHPDGCRDYLCGVAVTVL